MTVKKQKTGIFDNLSFEEYVAIDAINNSGLKTFHLTPAHYKEHKDHQKPSTGNFLIGQAVHCLAMEPGNFNKEFIRSKFDAYNSNESKAWLASANELGMKVLGTKVGIDPHWNPSEWDLVHLIADALLEHPIAGPLLDGIAERTLIWIDKETGELCKARTDNYSEGHAMLVDLKTAIDASFSGFTKAINNFGYYRQNAWYMDGAEACGMDVSNGFTFVVIEKAPPWAIGIYRLDDEWIRTGQVMNRHDLIQFKKQRELDEWPAYSDEIRDLPMPAYAKYHDVS